MTAWSVAGTAAAASTAAAAAAAAGRFGPTAASTSARSHARRLGYNAPAVAAAFPCARRTYASEAREYWHNNFAGPPPPPPLSTAPGLTSTASPSRTSSTVSSSASSGKDASSSAPLSRSVASRQPPPPGSPQHAAYAPDLPDTFGHNQDARALNQGVGLEGGLQGADEELQRDLESIVAHFRAPIRYAFAYGSGVLKQAGYSDKDKPMLDFVFAVSHPSHWHALNIHQNKEHYSLLARMLGSNIISILQTRVGASVWFNVECLVRGRIIKYGVVSVDSLVRDLLDWETLYLAGRLHKPVRVLRDEPRARLAAQVNLSSAVRTALLLLPETFSEEDLYTEVAALSYRGDFRMAVGENPNKVKNIVAAQGEQFQRLYQPILRSFHKHISFMGPEGSGSIRQDVSPRAKADLAKRLPARLKGALHGQYQRELNWNAALGKTVEGASSGSAGAGEKKASLSEETALWTKIVAQGNFKQSVDKTVQMIVGRPAFSQSAKGVVSVGPIRGLRYVWPKLKKKWAPGK